MPFTEKQKTELWREAGHCCASPFCRRPLSGPGGAINIGEAAHNKGENPGSARYDVSQNYLERNSNANGIYLCASCHSLIDNAEGLYPPDLIDQWKKDAADRYTLALHDNHPGIRGRIDLIDNRARARRFLDRHLTLKNEIVIFFYNSKPVSQIYIPQCMAPDSLRNAICIAEPLMEKYDKNRNDYCFEPLSNEYQKELVRLVNLMYKMPQISPFTTNISQHNQIDNTIFPGYFEITNPDTNNPPVITRKYTDPCAQLFQAYRDLYLGFENFINAYPIAPI